MNSIPLRVVLIASILLVAKVATGKAQADEQDLSATDSYEPPPASSCFDYFPDANPDSEPVSDSLESYTGDDITFLNAAGSSSSNTAAASSSASGQYHKVETHTKTYHVRNKDYAKGKAAKKVVKKVIWSKSEGVRKKAY